MIIFKIDVMSIAVFKSKSNPQVTTDFDCPGLSSISFQLMQVESGKAQVRNYLGRIHRIEAQLVQNTESGEYGDGPATIGACSYNTMADVHWASVEDAVGYNVYQSSYSEGPYTMINTDPIPDTLFRVSGLTNGADYYFVVRAVFADHLSLPSAEAHAAPTIAVLTPVTDMKLTREDSNIVLSWTAVSNCPDILGYRVARLNEQMAEIDFVTTQQTSLLIQGDADPTNTQNYHYDIQVISAE
jgi:hypothetical protein